MLYNATAILGNICFRIHISKQKENNKDLIYQQIIKTFITIFDLDQFKIKKYIKQNSTKNK